MPESEKAPLLEDDTTEKETMLIEHRLPWLIVGLAGGLLLTLVSSKFEKLLSDNIPLAFFIPVIVYMASAVGTQTDTVYIRNLNKKRTRFTIYLVKEFILGVVIGILFGTLTGSIAVLIFNSVPMGLSIGLSMAITMAIAPIIALIVPTILKREHKDPAVGTGPFVTVIQDFITLLIYFFIATLILFH